MYLDFYHNQRLRRLNLNEPHMYIKLQFILQPGLEDGEGVGLEGEEDVGLEEGDVDGDIKRTI